MPAAARPRRRPEAPAERPNLEAWPAEYFQRPCPGLQLRAQAIAGRTPISREALSSRPISLGFSMTTMTFLPSLTPSRAGASWTRPCSR